MSVRKSSHGTIFLIVSSGSPRALIASSLRATSKKLFCPMTRSLHPPMTACGHRVRFVATRREEFFEVPLSQLPVHLHSATRHPPDLLELRARIANHLGNRAEAAKIGLYLFHVGLARIRCHIDQKTDFWKRHFDFLE